MIYGYDPKTNHTFSCDNNDIVYLGKEDKDIKPPCSEEVALVFVTALTSGLSLDKLIVILPDNKPLAFCKENKLYGVKEVSWGDKYINQSNGLCYCSKPSENTYLERFPTIKAYIPDYGDANIALGYLIFNLINSEETYHPRRLTFLSKNEKEIIGNAKKYEDLDGDANGKMANFVARGYPVLNERYTTLGESLFYDRILFNDPPKDVECKYLVDRKHLDTLFPNLPISIRYASACIPLNIKNTEEFMKITEDESEFVTVRFLSQYDNADMHGFIQFVNIISGRLFVCSCKKTIASMYNNVCLYRHNNYLIGANV